MTRYKIAIQMYGYPNDLIVDIESGVWIPADTANSDYQQYLAWLAEGNTPEPWEAPNGAE